MPDRKINMRAAEMIGAAHVQAVTGVRPFGVASAYGAADVVRIVAFRSLKNTSIYADCMVDLVTGHAVDVRVLGEDMSVREAML